MRSWTRLLPILLVILVATATFAGEAPEVYGEGITDRETIPISVLMTDADDYVDKTVRVEGVITGVCQKAGCWMTLSNSGGHDEIKIKVDDGVIVFPAEAKGRRAIAEGRFVKIEMTIDETIAYKQHHADEQGEPFDPDSVTEAMTYYQIRGTGAEIR